MSNELKWLDDIPSTLFYILAKLSFLDNHIDPDSGNRKIRCASRNGFLETVKLLLQDERVDPSSNNNYCIKLASANGHTEIVEILLQDPRINPSAGDNYALKMAVKNGHWEIAKMLLHDARVDAPGMFGYGIKSILGSHHFDYIKMILLDMLVKVDSICTPFVELSLQYRQDIQINDSIPAPKNNAIILASKNGDPDVRVDPLNDQIVNITHVLKKYIVCLPDGMHYDNTEINNTEIIPIFIREDSDDHYFNGSVQKFTIRKNAIFDLIDGDYITTCAIIGEAQLKQDVPILIPDGIACTKPNVTIGHSISNPIYCEILPKDIMIMINGLKMRTTAENLARFRPGTEIIAEANTKLTIGLKISTVNQEIMTYNPIYI